VIKVLLVFLIALSLTGCNNSDQMEEIHRLNQENIILKDQLKALEMKEDSTSDERSYNDMLVDIREKAAKWMDYDDLIILDTDLHDLYVVKGIKETFADDYFVYDDLSQALFKLPHYGDFVSDYEIISRDYIVLEMNGKHSEVAFINIPFIYECRKVLQEDGTESFISYRKDKFFTLDEGISFGGKKGQVLEEFIVTLRGIQVSFGPQDPNDSMYFAGSIYPPYTSTAYNEASQVFTLVFEDTIVDGNLFLSDLSNHKLFEKIDLVEEDGLLKINIKLNDTGIQFYTGDMLLDHSSNGLEFNFYTK